MSIRPQIVYSPRYDIRFGGLEKLHPFDSCKYSRIWKTLIKSLGERLSNDHHIPLEAINLDLIKLVHSEPYLKQLLSSNYVAKALELSLLNGLPMSIIDHCVLKPMRLAAQGTVIAAQLALDHRIAINLSGGYHHASADQGEGFCIYSDIAIAIQQLRRLGKIKLDDSIVIIDLDAHQGNGLERIFFDDPQVYILDMYNQDIYPNDNLAKQRINCNIPLSYKTGDDQYLTLLQESLPLFLGKIPEAKIAFYNAGTDIYEQDELGMLNVSQSGIWERDRLVFNSLINAGIPWVMVLSGGYTRYSYQLVANSINYIWQTWNN